MSKEQSQPFKALGQRLKAIRQKMHESVGEVSGAVEIDTVLLERIEQGSERPTEDILQLLINHFGMQDDDAADGLWKLAGYEPHGDHVHDDLEENMRSGRGAMMILAVDPRVMYSDHIQVSANASGVVLNFAQRSLPQPMITARVGMSREQAREVLRVLHQALERSEPRQLPAPSRPDIPAKKQSPKSSTDKSDNQNPTSHS